MLVLEDESAARRRGAARIYGELAGYAATFDPPNGDGEPIGPVGPHDPPRGSASSSRLGRAAELAMADAGVTPEQVDVVFADAWGRPDLDRAEAEAIAKIFGPYGIPVTAPKSMTGRLYAGGGALDLATALLAMRDSVLPPTINVSSLAPGCEIDLVVGTAREQAVGTALVLARGLGGFNAAAVLTSVN
jgi:act minimal PKS chain-length factor (CLF/KS beta)